MIWSEKYKPKDTIDMIGNEYARSLVVTWIKNWEKGTKPIILIGPPGVGKTTIVNIIAKKLDYDIICLNASDIRNKQQIEDVINPTINNLGLFGKTIVFVDEVDGIHGRYDYGGTEALIKILKIPVVPIILAANYETDKIKNIKKLTIPIYFHRIAPRLLLLYALSILNREKSLLSTNKLNDIVIKSNGDARFMINSLQTAVTGFKPQQEKSFELSIEKCISNFFASSSITDARHILYTLKVDPYTKINVFYSSIINSDVQVSDLTKMFMIISDADILYKQILQTQSWRLLRYLNEILIGLYIYKYPITYSKFNLSWQLINKIRFNGSKINKISLALAKKFHASSNKFKLYYLPYMLFYINNTKKHHDVDELDELHEMV